MKIEVALVGCGSVGSTLAVQFLKRGNIEYLKLVDSHLENIENLTSRLNGMKSDVSIKTQRADATDEKEMRQELDEAEIVINAASPFCNIPMMKACLHSGTNYIDLASDPFEYSDQKKTTFEAQLELHDDFVKKGLLAVTNAGISPGLTDILTKAFIEKYSLDSVDNIEIYLAEEIRSDEFVISWSPHTFLLEYLLPPTILKQNEITVLDAEESYRKIEFSPPIGEMKLKVFNGHPELRTIPQYIDKPIDQIEIAGAYRLNEMNSDEIILKALEKQITESFLFQGDILEILSSSFKGPENFMDLFNEGIVENEISEFIYRIKGRKDDEILQKEVTITHTLKEISKSFPVGTVSSFMVSFVPVIISEKILENEIERVGVIAPAGLENSMEIIEECGDMGLLEETYID